MRGLLLLLVTAVMAVAAEPLRVVATVPELGALAREVLGEEADVSTLARSREDPHTVIAKPSFIPRLRRADLLLEVGLELEIGWLPPLLEGARRTDLVRVAVGDQIEPLGVPTTTLDRSHGHVHGAGNPHALCDPLVGWRMAKAIVAAAARLRPERDLTPRLDAFAVALAKEWIGHDLPPADARAVLEADNPLMALAVRNREPQGWWAALADLRGRRLVADHDLWPYLAQRFGFQVVAFLEPVPGVPPTQAHLTALITRVRSEGLGPLIVAPYSDRRHAEQVVRATGIALVELPHQAADEDVTYRAWIGRLVTALQAAR